MLDCAGGLKVVSVEAVKELLGNDGIWAALEECAAAKVVSVLCITEALEKGGGL